MCILCICVFYVSVYIHIHRERMLLLGNLSEGEFYTIFTTFL